MNPYEMTTAIAAVASSLACQLSNKELSYWGIILSQLGSDMQTIAALQDLRHSSDLSPIEIID